MGTEQNDHDYINDYDMNSAELAEDWDNAVQTLHAGCPMARSNVGEGYWMVSKQQHIKEIAQDWETFTSTTGFMPNRPEDWPKLYPVEVDPPFHTAIRSAINHFLSPGVVRTYEDAVRQHARDLLAEFEGEEKIDAVAKFGNALPARTFCVTVAGMSTDDIEFLQEKFEIGMLGPLEERAEAMQAAVGRQEKYLAQRAKEPSRGDIVNAILDIDAEGVDWTVKASVLSTLTLGGVGTTGYAISSALHYLATHPEERKRLIENPELWLTATEEFLRFFAASPHDGRRVTRDTSVAGTELKPGEYVLMNYGAGSRDPDVFEQPYEVVLDRPLPNRHISFGYGVHRCIGSHLARLEVRVGLQEFLARYPDFSVPDDFEPSYQINNSVTLEQLPLLLS